MKRILLIILIVFLPIKLFSAFLDPGWGARATSMGGAYTSLSDDASGIFWNPAGTSQVNRIESTFMYAKPFMGLDLYAGENKTDLGMQFGSVVYPFKVWGSAGVSFVNLSVSDLYSEKIYLLNYSITANKIDRFFKKFKKKNSFGTINFGKKKKTKKIKTNTIFGMNLKLLRHEYTLDKYSRNDPVFSGGTSKSALSLDLGVLVIIQDKLSIGASFKDLNSPDVGLKSEDKVPLESRLGFSYRIGKFIPAIDFSYRDKYFNIHAGGEFKMLPLFFRAGGNLDEIAAGFGIFIEPFKLDYSFIWPLEITATSGTHRLSASFRFGIPHTDINENADIKTGLLHKPAAPAKGKIKKKKPLKKKKAVIIKKTEKPKAKKKIKKKSPKKIKPKFKQKKYQKQEKRLF